MKKRFLSTLLALVCACSFLPACGWGKDKESTPPPNVSVKEELNEAVMDLSNATNLAIVKRKDVTKKETTVKTMSSDVETLTPEQLEEIKREEEIRSEALVLATIRRNQLIEEITFKREGEANFVTQDALGVEVYKMKVIGDFTFFSFISSSVRESLTTQEVRIYIKDTSQVDKRFSVFGYMDTSKSDAASNLGYGGVYEERFQCLTPSGGFWDLADYREHNDDPLLDKYVFDRTFDEMEGISAEFDEKYYRCNDIMQSYVVYNKTGKVYSLDKFPVFDIQCETVIKADNDYYQYWVDENDNLVMEEILPNPSVRVSDVQSDIYGWLYIYNHGDDENTTGVDEKDEAKKRIYWTGSNRDKIYAYMKARDRHMYAWVDYYNTYGPTIKMVNGQETEIDTSTTAYGENGWFIKEGLFVRSSIGNIAYDLTAHWTDVEINITYPAGGINNIITEGEWLTDEYDWKYYKKNGGVQLVKYDWKKIRENSQENEEGDREYRFSSSDMIFLEGVSLVRSSVTENYEDSEIALFVKEGANKREYYTLGLNEETGEYELQPYSEVTIDRVYYVIQPLN